jgi:hypothetical protein
MIVEIFLSIFFSLLVGMGFLLVFTPYFPALLYMFVVTVVFSAIENFSVITSQNLIVLGAVVLVSFFVYASFVFLKAGEIGAFKKIFAYGFLGLLIGLIILPPFGGAMGLLAGVWIADRSRFQHESVGDGGFFPQSFYPIKRSWRRQSELVLAFVYFILFLFFLAY